MPDEHDLFDADADTAIVEANRREFERAEAERQPSQVTVPGAPDPREALVRRRLGGVPWLLGTPAIDDYLEKHSATHILASVEKYDRAVADGKIVGHPVRYLEGIMAQKGPGRGGRKSLPLGEATGDQHKRHDQVMAECTGEIEHRLVKVNDDGSVTEEYIVNDASYGRDVLRALRLARWIASHRDHPDRAARIREWQNLP